MAKFLTVLTCRGGDGSALAAASTRARKSLEGVIHSEVSYLGPKCFTCPVHPDLHRVRGEAEHFSGLGGIESLAPHQHERHAQALREARDGVLEGGGEP